MRSVNKVILIGNLTRDPQMRQTPSGQNVTTFTIATNREWISKDNQKHALAEYHDVVAWARLAEICQQYLRKGKLVYIEGYLKTRSWETEGVKKFKTEIVVQDMIMLEKRTNNENEEMDYIPEEESVSEVKSHPAPAPKNNPMPVSAPARSHDLVSASIDIDKDLGL